MSISIMLRRLMPMAGLSAVLFHASGVFADDKTGDWLKAQRDVTDVLMKGEPTIAELAANLAKSRLRTAQDAMFKVSVLMRAGMNQETVAALRELKALSPQLENHQVNGIYYDACEKLLAWDAAKATVEVFADNISEMSLENRLLKHLLESGWTVEKVDAWLAGMPEGVNGFWVKERVRFNRAHARGDALVKDLADRVRENPQDIEGAIVFLEALLYARYPENEPADLSWMAETIRPTLATQAEQIASRLKTLLQCQTATRFYGQAIDIPLTEAEIQELRKMCARAVSTDALRAMFAVRVREAMAECLLQTKKEEEAQKRMVEAADIREKHRLGRNAIFAGRTQAASGGRVIEGRIKEKEKQSEDDPQYWRERAAYYRGRGEAAQEEQALAQGLALTKPQPKPERPSRSHVDWRSALLGENARFLMREKRVDEAVPLLRREIEEAPAASESTQTAAHFLAYELEKHVTTDDAVLWRWLENRPQWTTTEERLLWRMLQSAPREELDKHMSRAENIALGNDPTRAFALGWIMNRMHFAERSIPLLVSAAENARDKDLKERAQFSLFESYLDTGDWKLAEELFPEAAKQLTPMEVPEWYSRLAVTAASAGAKTDAMRLWSRTANLCPCQLGRLKLLAEAGLSDKLRDFYRDLQKNMPSSHVPARALMVLETQDADS